MIKLKIMLFLVTGILLFLGCGGIKNNNMEANNKPRALETELNLRKENFAKKAPAEKQKIYAEGIHAVKVSDVVGKALQVGDIATNFTLPNASGSNVTLYDELKKGSVILMWYRGGWCPYCNLTLHYMQEALPEFKKYKANLLAVSPEVPDSSMTTKEKNELEFEVLSDVDNKVASQYKILFSLTDEVAQIYENSFGLSKYNGNSKGELPLAATYIIGQDKVIKYAFLDPDYRNRAEPQDLIDFLKRMK
ncbi:MAG: peroxiredoxin-like family protein [Saprospiraceae bacterium]